jgi:hypothetical protein
MQEICSPSLEAAGLSGIDCHKNLIIFSECVEAALEGF